MDGWTGWSDSLRDVAVVAAGARMARWAGLTHGSSDVASGRLSYMRRVDRPGAYIDRLLPGVLDGTAQPGRVFDAAYGLDGIALGYRDMAGRATLKALVIP